MPWAVSHPNNLLFWPTDPEKVQRMAHEARWQSALTNTRTLKVYRKTSVADWKSRHIDTQNRATGQNRLSNVQPHLADIASSNKARPIARHLKTFQLLSPSMSHKRLEFPHTMSGCWMISGSPLATNITASNLVASLLLVAMPFAPSSVLAPSSDARSP